jgi:transcriptional regulator with XRE-family HTH domain
VQEESTTKVVFSNNLIALMDCSKITQDQLAEHMGVSQTTVWKWRKGAIPDGLFTVKLADFFGVSEKSLFENHEHFDTTKAVSSNRSNTNTRSYFPPIKKLKISKLREDATAVKTALEQLTKAVSGLEKRLGELEGD